MLKYQKYFTAVPTLAWDIRKINYFKIYIAINLHNERFKDKIRMHLIRCPSIADICVWSNLNE